MAAQAARIHGARGVDELMIIDIDATKEGRGPDLDLIRDLSEDVFIPITVGGGICTVAHIDAALRAGADKVLICTAAFTNESLVEEASARFGAQAIVGCVEVAGGGVTHSNSAVKAANTSPTDYASELQSRGCGEILLSSVERDGMMGGYDLELIQSVAHSLSVPLIASGGCGEVGHMLEAFKAGADACASGAMFLFTDETPKAAARHLSTRGLEMRL